MSTVLITGANRGIGLSLCQQYHERGETVIAVCRSSSEELNALGIRIEAGVDVTDRDSVDRLAQQLAGSSIEILVNNAGLLTDESLQDLGSEQAFDRMRRQYEINALGPLRVTGALSSCLAQGAKVALVTSRMGSIDDNTSGGRYGYRMSKAALNIAGVSLAKDLRSRQIAVAILHPGYVRTGMTRFTGMIDAPESAAGLIDRIDDLTLETSGRFWHQNGERLPW